MNLPESIGTGEIPMGLLDSNGSRGRFEDNLGCQLFMGDLASVGFIDSCAKNMTQVNRKILLMKSSKKYFIFLLAFYRIMWLMISPKNFEKIAILKI